MNSFWLFLNAALLGAFPAFAEIPTEIRCPSVSLLVSYDQHGPVLQHTDYSIAVVDSTRGLHGFEADVVNDGRSLVIYDVTVEAVAPSSVPQLAEMVGLLLPQLDFRSLSSVRLSRIDGGSGRQEGSAVLELFDGKGRGVGKIVELGYSFGLCSR